MLVAITKQSKDEDRSWTVKDVTHATHTGNTVTGQLILTLSILFNPDGHKSQWHILFNDHA